MFLLCKESKSAQSSYHDLSLYTALENVYKYLKCGYEGNKGCTIYCQMIVIAISLDIPSAAPHGSIEAKLYRNTTQVLHLIEISIFFQS